MAVTAPTRQAPASVETGQLFINGRLEHGRFIWPSPAEGVVTITPAQLGYLLEGIDWRHPQRSWRPERAG